MSAALSRYPDRKCILERKAFWYTGYYFSWSDIKNKYFIQNSVCFSSSKLLDIFCELNIIILSCFTYKCKLKLLKTLQIDVMRWVCKMQTKNARWNMKLFSKVNKETNKIHMCMAASLKKKPIMTVLCLETIFCCSSNTRHWSPNLIMWYAYSCHFVVVLLVGKWQ